jgi:rRNA maturation protein Nop10
MVSAKHPNPIAVPESEHPTQYQLIDLVVGLPTEKPSPDAMMQARPFEFVLDIPSNYSAMCPFCCAGFYVSPTEIKEQYGYKFVACPECGAGQTVVPKPPPPFVDPFVNPFDSKQLLRCELDETITPIADIAKSADNTLTVAQKMGIECEE